MLVTSSLGKIKIRVNCERRPLLRDPGGADYDATDDA